MNLQKQKQQFGFTLIELIVVIGILGLLATVFIINFVGTRGSRNLKIAENELVTNIRKIQSYTASSRNTPSGNPTRYYFAEFNYGGSAYSIYAIDNVSIAPQLVETVNFPAGLIIGGLFLQQPAGIDALRPNCVQVAFGSPYGKIYMDGNCTLRTGGSIIDNPVALTPKGNSVLTLWLTQQRSNTSIYQLKIGDKFVTISGVNGRVSGYDSPPPDIPGVCFDRPLFFCDTPPPPPGNGPINGQGD